MKMDNGKRLAAPENLYIPGIKIILKKISRQVAAILIIGGELKIWSGDLHTHG